MVLWISWVLSPQRPMAVFIMDKSSFSDERQKNRAINWVLTHYKFVKEDGQGYYDARKDYLGFFPGDDARYETDDLSGKSPEELEELAKGYHMAYYADSYGVHSDVWPEIIPSTLPAHQIYGGLEQEDVWFLEHMLQQDKLVVAEFIFLSPPTSEAIRAQAEEIFGMQWQKWTGKFFHTFNPEIERSVPPWVPVLYESQYDERWNPEGSGMIFVHEDGTLVVLQHGKHLNKANPHIHSSRDIRNEYGMSRSIPYPGWFDIIMPDGGEEEVLSWLEPDLTPEGKMLLSRHGIPHRFPALIRRSDPGLFYYFAGDFAHSPLKRRFVRAKGSRYAELFFSDLTDLTDKSAYFYAFYLPVMKNVMREYHAGLPGSGN